jgi:CBS domain-containing protein
MEQSLLPNIYSFLSTVSPFTHISSDELNALVAKIEILYLAKGKSLSTDKIIGQGLYIVKLGAVEQYNLDQTLRARLGDGDIFGFSHLNRKDTCTYTVKAIENTLLYRVPKNELTQLIQTTPALEDYFSEQASVRLAKSTSLMKIGEESIFLRPVDSVMNSHTAEVSQTTSIYEAAKIMVNSRRSSALVMEKGQLLGIITDRDMTKRVIAEGIDIHRPVTDIMTSKPHTIKSGTSMLDAIEIMMQHNVKSLPIVGDDHVKGIVTATSLIERSQVQAIFLISRIYRKKSLSELIALTPQRNEVFKTLVETRTHPRAIQHMMTLIADAFNKRLLQLAEEELGPPPMKYVWFVAGSQGRFETHNLSDQDNGIILQRKASKQENEYFEKLSEFVCHGLDKCGYVLCTGEMMATNPRWCIDINTWLEYFRSWIITPESEALLNASVFFDIRALYGEIELAENLKEQINNYLKGNSRFISIMLANSLRVTPPLGIFRQFVFEKSGKNRKEFNIKKHAINLLVELARIYAIASGSTELLMGKRLQASVESGLLSGEGCREIQEAFDFINQVRFTRQSTATEHNEKQSNNIAPESLTQFEKNHLKDAFRIITRYQEAAEQRFKSSGMLR